MGRGFCFIKVFLRGGERGEFWRKAAVRLYRGIYKEKLCLFRRSEYKGDIVS